MKIALDTDDKKEAVLQALDHFLESNDDADLLEAAAEVYNEIIDQSEDDDDED